jgi:hypothetical protein
MNQNNGEVIMQLQGTKKDFTAAWLVRMVFGALLGYVAYTMHETAKDSQEGRDGVIEIKATLPSMQKDIGELKEQGKTFATKAQLEAAETRVKNEFAEQLKKSKRIAPSGY